MSEYSETPTTRTSTATAPAPALEERALYRTPRVFKAAAWVAIVAGTVFVVAVIFFTGMALGHHGGGHHHGHKHHAMMHHHQGFPNGGAPAVSQSPTGPSQVPSSVAPSVAPSTTPGR
jgi:hypothetical protein